MKKEKKDKKMPLRKLFDGIKSNISASIILGIILLFLVFGVFADMIGYQQFSKEFTDEYSQNALHIAKAAATFIDVDQLDTYLETGGDSEEYRNTYSTLEMMCNHLNARFIYVIQPDTVDYEHITFVFNTVNSTSGFEPYEIGLVKETTNEEYQEKYQNLYEGITESETVVRDSGFIESGAHITEMIALHKSDGSVAGILCVQRQMDGMVNARKNYTFTIIAGTVLLAGIITVIFIFCLRRYVIDPIRVITKETERFAAAPTPAEQPLSEYITFKNEIGTLAESVDMMEKETLDYMEDVTRITAEKERIGTELELASAIQQGMLNSVYPDREEFDLCASMTPAKEVGGDFYDYFMIDDDHLGLVMADVSGKGVPAALFMMVSKILLSEAATLLNSPSEILRVVNDRICKKNNLDMFVTVWLGILEISTGIITAANAGHEYPVICRSAEGYTLLKDQHGFVIGGMKGVKYRDYTIELKKGDVIFLYTDGVCEATNAQEELYGSERMLRALNRDYSLSPALTLQAVKQDVDAFVGDAPQFDDLTMMCVKYLGKN